MIDQHQDLRHILRFMIDLNNKYLGFSIYPQFFHLLGSASDDITKNLSMLDKLFLLQKVEPTFLYASRQQQTCHSTNTQHLLTKIDLVFLRCFEVELE